jgi:hypothetical protein
MGVTTMTREKMDEIVNDHFGYEATDDIEGVRRPRAATRATGRGHA